AQAPGPGRPQARPRTLRGPGGSPRRGRACRGPRRGCRGADGEPRAGRPRLSPVVRPPSGAAVKEFGEDGGGRLHSEGVGLEARGTPRCCWVSGSASPRTGQASGVGRTRLYTSLTASGRRSFSGVEVVMQNAEAAQ